MDSKTLRPLALAVTIAVAAAGCAGESAQQPAGPSFNTTTPPPPTDQGGNLTVCKVGSSASFNVYENGVLTQTVALADGECRLVADAVPLAVVASATEIVPPGTVLDSIVVTSTFRGVTTTTTLTGTATVGGGIGDTFIRAVYYNRVLPPPPPPTTVTVCKVGTGALFTVSVNGGTAFGLGLSDGECRVVDTHDGLTPAHLVSITELVQPTSFVLDSIVVLTTGGVKTVLTGVETATATADDNGGATVTFYNRLLPPPPSGGQGCTPGYWKQRQHFDSWTAPYAPTTLFSDVFENAFPGKTLLDVLKLGGGGLNALGRHTVAALLNSASGSGVNYDMSAQGVIDAFNAVFPSGDYEGQKNIFATYNEQGCPLN